MFAGEIGFSSSCLHVTPMFIWYQQKDEKKGRRTRAQFGKKKKCTFVGIQRSLGTGFVSSSSSLFPVRASAVEQIHCFLLLLLPLPSVAQQLLSFHAELQNLDGEFVTV